MVLRKWTIKLIIYVCIFSIISCFAVSAETIYSNGSLVGNTVKTATTNNTIVWFEFNCPMTLTPDIEYHAKLYVPEVVVPNFSHQTISFSFYISLWSSYSITYNITTGEYTNCYNVSFNNRFLEFDFILPSTNSYNGQVKYNINCYTTTTDETFELLYNGQTAVQVFLNNSQANDVIDSINNTSFGLLNIAQSIFGFIMSSPLAWVLLGVTVSFIGWGLYQIKRII